MAQSWLHITLGKRIASINIVSIIGMALILYMSAHFINEALMDGRVQQTKRLVDVAKSIVTNYDAKVKAGEMTLQDAQKAAIATIQGMRYDGVQYFWINHMDGTMIMHPTSPKLNGTSLLELKDARGAKIFADMIDVVKKDGKGDYQYFWPPEGAEPKLKVSHVAGISDWQWIIGSGVFVDDAQAHANEVVLELAYAVVAVLLVSLIAASLISRSISRPVKKITDTMVKVAQGELNVYSGLTGRTDELGDMARAVDVFRNNAKEMIRIKAEQEEKDRLSAEQKKQEMMKMADDFEHSVGSIVSVVASAATQLQSHARNLTQMSDQTSRQSANVAAATEEASASVQTVASAAEELSASIGEINRQVQESSAISKEAVDEVAKTDATVSTLSEAAAQIGDVVKLIQDIAEQTNLLALNATIEAARAGEAGKGFAVVASEVKNLATQTGRATEEISKKIVTVQSVTNEAVQAIRNIGSTIEKISTITASISGAIQQQNSATKEISNNVQQASAGTAEVSSSIVNVTHAASESLTAASEVLTASNDLTKQSEQLRLQIADYVSKVRGG